MRKDILDFNPPVNWKGWKKAKKLQFLVEKLPSTFVLTIFREPRNCRKNKSLYIKSISPAPQEKPKPDAYRIVDEEQPEPHPGIDIDAMLNRYAPPRPGRGPAAEPGRIQLIWEEPNDE
jgi:hypothetical protein